jgi:hypothetical protein
MIDGETETEAVERWTDTFGFGPANPVPNVDDVDDTDGD